MKPRAVEIAVALLLGAHIFLYGFFQLVDDDTWWHMSQGRLFVTAHAIPAQDPFAFTTAGHAWIKFSWVADILYYLVYHGGGPSAMVLLRLALFLAICGALYAISVRMGAVPLLAMLLVLVASMGLRFRLVLRPETVAFLVLLAMMAVLASIAAGARWRPYLLLPVQLLWVNVHASFVFGIAIPGLVLVANLLPRRIFAPGWGALDLDPRRRLHLGTAVATLPLVSLLNPNGAALLAFPFRQNAMTRLGSFKEWASLFSLPAIAPVWWEVVLAHLLVIAAILGANAILLAARRRIDPVGIGLSLSMGAYAIRYNRAVPYFLLAAIPVLAATLARLAELPGADPARLRRLGSIVALVALPASIAAQLLLPQPFPRGFGIPRDTVPEEACAFLERHHLDGRVFNSYELGGYLIWRRFPANQVLIDGRYDAVLFDESLLEDYAAAHRQPLDLDRVTRPLGIQILVIAANPRLMRHIGSHPAWALVHWDAVAEVYVRRDGPHAELATRLAYHLTRGDRDLSYLAAYRRDPAAAGAALAELRRAVAEDAGNTLAWVALSQELRVQAPGERAERKAALGHAVTLLGGTDEARELAAELSSLR